MYLDPGFGGMLIQIVVAIVAAGGAILFAMRKKIRALFSKNSKGSDAAALPNETPGMADRSEDDIIDMLSEDENQD